MLNNFDLPIVNFSLLGGFVFPSDPFVDAAAMSGIVAELKVHLKKTAHFERNKYWCRNWWRNWNDGHSLVLEFHPEQFN